MLRRFIHKISPWRALPQITSFAKFVTVLKMVRFFPNTAEDYEPGASVYIDKTAIKQQIDEHLKNITKRLQPTTKNVDGGLYVGVTGVAYMFYHLSKNPQLSENKKEYLNKAIEYATPATQKSAGDRTSFLLGDAGTYALMAVLGIATNDDSYGDSINMYKTLYNLYLNKKFLKCGGDEFFVGRAGYLAGALWLTRELQTIIFSQGELYKICEVIVNSGREYSRSKKFPCPLMYHYYDTAYLGAAHGVTTILQMLLNVPGYLEHDKSAARDIKATIDYITSIQTEEGNWPCCMEELGIKEHKLVHWCHGAPGTVYLMAKAFMVYKDQKYLDACIKSADLVWNKGLLRKGPGICHGVAGNGYVFLLLYRLTGDDKYLHRAKVFANFMTSNEFQTDARVPDNPESLYEGTAGTVCFLADLLTPEKAEFPFQDVFTQY